MRLSTFHMHQTMAKRVEWEVRQEYKKNESFQNEYNQTIRFIAKAIVTDPEDYIKVLKQATQLLKKNSKSGFFFKTEHDYANNFLKIISGVGKLKTVYAGLKYVINECEMNAKKGLQAYIVSETVIWQEGTHGRMKELAKKLNKKPYSILCDIKNGLNCIFQKFFDEEKGNLETEALRKEKLVVKESINRALEGMENVTEIVMSYRY